MAARSAHCGAVIRGQKPGTSGLGRRMDRHTRRRGCPCPSVCVHLLGTYCTTCGKAV